MKNIIPFSIVIVLISACESSNSSPDDMTNIDGARLSHRRTELVGSDGFVSTRRLDIYDTKLQLPCSPMNAEDGTMRCMPFASAYDGYFADVNCTQAIGYESTDPCSLTLPTFVGSIIPGDECSTSAKYVLHEVGTSFVGQLYRRDNGNCQMVQAFPTHRYFLLGKKLPPSDFVELDVRTVP